MQTSQDIKLPSRDVLLINLEGKDNRFEVGKVVPIPILECGDGGEQHGAVGSFGDVGYLSLSHPRSESSGLLAAESVSPVLAVAVITVSVSRGLLSPLLPHLSAPTQPETR